MLSICIPVYNRNIKTLVDRLHNQAQKVDAGIEIVVIDDASETVYQQENEQNCQGKANYIQLESNIGRSRIRNLFLQYTSQPFLIFLDCDVVIPDSEFVQRYFNMVKERAPQLVAGGHYYKAEKVEHNKLLRWKFGVQRESPEAIQRSRNPYKSFKTSNFMVSLELFKKINFDETIKGYGHEDTLFGYEIKQKNIPIVHIENPVLIKDLDTNQEFLEKTKRSIENLILLLPKVNYDSQFINDVTLLKVYYSLKRKHILWIVYLIYSLFNRLILRKLLNGSGSLRLFDFYKLGYLIKLNKG
ncbi:MAG: glycosyl transferase family 2 [Salinivirgaceae bacterium]|nr:MAG: glycosyl transferase family 2 [Salinivirgaceae bacterium]